MDLQVLQVLNWQCTAMQRWMRVMGSKAECPKHGSSLTQLCCFQDTWLFSELANMETFTMTGTNVWVWEDFAFSEWTRCAMSIDALRPGEIFSGLRLL